MHRSQLAPWAGMATATLPASRAPRTPRLRTRGEPHCCCRARLTAPLSFLVARGSLLHLLCHSSSQLTDCHCEAGYEPAANVIPLRCDGEREHLPLRGSAGPLVHVVGVSHSPLQCVLRTPSATVPTHARRVLPAAPPGTSRRRPSALVHRARFCRVPRAQVCRQTRDRARGARAHG